MSIGELQKESLFGLSVKASLEQKDGMIPVLRMSNIQNGEIQYDDLKYLPYECAVTDAEPDKWLLRKGDFLITRTNGSKDLVGKAAVFNSDDTYTYASYLIRYRFDTDIVLPEYVNIIFMTPLVREQIAVLRRQGGGQYNLNSDEVNSIQIPVPDIPTQRKIIQLYEDSLMEAKRLRKQANDIANSAEEYFEKSLYL
jgi:type I restriction enzyme S subunit